MTANTDLNRAPVTLADVLGALLRVDDSRVLETLLRNIHLDSFDPPLTDTEQATLRNAIYSAAARCWVRRSLAED
jgi:hypothetical protein